MTDLRLEREAAGLTTVKAAQLLGIGRKTLWRYETGKTQRYDLHLVERMRALYKARRRRKPASGRNILPEAANASA